VLSFRRIREDEVSAVHRPACMYTD
jgi:hypothetical protein